MVTSNYNIKYYNIIFFIHFNNEIQDTHTHTLTKNHFILLICVYVKKFCT